MNETESRDGFDSGTCMQGKKKFRFCYDFLICLFLVVKSEPLDLSSDVEESSTESGKIEGGP